MTTAVGSKAQLHVPVSVAAAPSAPESLVAPASEAAASETAASETVAAPSEVAPSEAPASVAGGVSIAGGSGTQRQRLWVVTDSQTAYATGSHGPPAGVVAGQNPVVGVTVVIVAPPLS